MIEAPDGLLTFLRSEEQRAKDDELDGARATALAFYAGMPFGDEEDGRSQVVTRDVAEVIDYLTVGILGTMVAGDKVVEFEGTGEEEAEEPEQAQSAQPGSEGETPPKPRKVDYGEQVTASVVYQFMRKQKGYRILHDSLKAGLLEKSGIVKTFVEPQPAKRVQYQVPAEALQSDGRGGVAMQGMVVTAADPMDVDLLTEEPLSYLVTVEQPQPPMFRDEAVPNEEFLVAPDARDLDEALYIGHRTPKTLSDLVRMGFDAEELQTVWGSTPASTIVENARDSGRSQTRQTVSTRSGEQRAVWLMEEYILWDMDGDGIAERVCVHRIGEHVLSIQPVEEQPFSIWSPFPTAHRLIGQSAADKTMDIQRVRSVLLRQALDSLYLANKPRVLVSEDAETDNTIDDILRPEIGAVIRYKGGVPPTNFQIADISPSAFRAMEMMTGERESRTGVTRQNQGLNPDTLNKTATGMAMLQASGDQIELYIARNFAEFIVAPMFAKRYRLMRQHGTPFRMKIDGQYVDIDPRKWPEEMDIAINVGLGTGRKDQRIQYRAQLLGIQQQIAQSGSRIVGDEQIFANVKGLIADAALGTATDYVIDPATLPPAGEKPDPAMMAEQAKATIEAERAKVEQQRTQADAMLKANQQQIDERLGQERLQAELALKTQAADLDAQLKRDNAAEQSDLARAKATEEARLAQQRFDFESGLALQRMQFEQDLAERQERARASAADDDAVLPALRPGGALDQ